MQLMNVGGLFFVSFALMTQRLRYIATPLAVTTRHLFAYNRYMGPINAYIYAYTHSNSVICHGIMHIANNLWLSKVVNKHPTWSGFFFVEVDSARCRRQSTPPTELLGYSIPFRWLAIDDDRNLCTTQGMPADLFLHVSWPKTNSGACVYMDVWVEDGTWQTG